MNLITKTLTASAVTLAVFFGSAAFLAGNAQTDTTEVASTIEAHDAHAIARRWKVTRVIDGDTFEVETKFFPPELGNIRVRVAGIDTPESGGHAKCDAERALAVKAKDLAVKTLTGKTVTITDIEADKYGERVVAEVALGGASYADMMVKAGVAVIYYGGTKHSWCN